MRALPNLYLASRGNLSLYRNVRANQSILKDISHPSFLKHQFCLTGPIREPVPSPAVPMVVTIMHHTSTAQLIITSNRSLPLQRECSCLKKAFSVRID